MQNMRTPLAVGLLLGCSLVPACAFSQIVPSPYTPPTPATVETTPQDQSGFAPKDEPTASILGWSFTSEVDPSVLRPTGEVTLDPGQPEIILFFNTVRPPTTAVEYRYRLEDYDLDWTVTRDPLAHYRRLSPGHYRFEVQAHTPGQRWRSTIATFPIYQRPFFWQNRYFYLFVFLCLCALAAQLLNQHDQLLKGQMGMVLGERNRIASDCHDTLMAGFAAISWQLEATAKLFKDGGESASPTAQSCELARSMVAHCQAEARRIIWDLRDSEEVTNILSRALSRAISAHRLRDKIETTFEVEGDEMPIAPGAVHHLVCIGQEAVTNAIRHADSSRIRVLLRYETDSLSLTIRDNGRGFQPSSDASRTGHFGIPVMEERARKLGGALRFTTSADAGTEVAVTVRFQTINQPVNQQHYIVPWIGV
jgi:signal transduction histidine kinase